MRPVFRRTIAIVAPDLGAGGSVSAVALRHAAALSEGNRVILVSRTPPAALPDDVEFVGVQARKWNWLRRLCHVPNEVSFARATRRVLDGLHARTPLDVVWCHSHSTTALAAAPLRAMGVRSIMTTHGDIFDRPAGTYTRELAWYYRRVTPLAYRRADRIQVLSPAMRDRALASGAEPGHVHLVPNGLDPREIGWPEAPPPRGAQDFMPQQAVRLLYVGSLWHVKGPDVLLRAMRLLLDAGLRVQAKYIGSGAPDALQMLAAQLEVGDTVQWLGAQPRTSLGTFYRDCDLVVVPSRSEALSTAVLEGMSCGTPIVASRTGGLCVQVEDGVTGLLATPDDAADLARAIRAAAESPQRLAQMGAAGQVRVLRDYDWRHVAQQLQAMVDSACGETNPSAANG